MAETATVGWFTKSKKKKALEIPDTELNPQKHRYFSYKDYFADMESSHELSKLVAELMENDDLEVYRKLEISARVYCDILERLHRIKQAKCRLYKSAKAGRSGTAM